MRAVLRLAVLTVALGLPALAQADEQQMSRMPAKPGEQAKGPSATPWYREPRAIEPCWGDSTEKDADLNEGSRITTEEILRIINPAQS